MNINRKQGETVKFHTPFKEDDLLLKTLSIALEESLALQRHYAELLNRYDGGQRMIFETSESWIARLREIGTL